MSNYDCDTMRDLIPSLVRGDLLPHEKLTADQHLIECAECRDEVSIVRLMHDNLEPVPAGLEARVLLAARRIVPQRRWSPARLAMAATVAATVIGGSLIFERFYASPEPQLIAEAPFDASVAAELSWAATQDVMLHGSSSLYQLSVEELEVLLAELES